MEGGPLPSARVGGNYGEAEGRQTDETWLPYTRGGGWEASLPWATRAEGVWGGTRADACGCRLGTVGKLKSGEGRAEEVTI